MQHLRGGSSPPSDTQTGEISRKQTPLEHAARPTEGRRAVPAPPRGETAMTAPLIAPLIPPAESRYEVVPFVHALPGLLKA